MPAMQRYKVYPYAVNTDEVTSRAGRWGYPEEPCVLCRLYLYRVLELEN